MDLLNVLGHLQSSRGKYPSRSSIPSSLPIVGSIRLSMKKEEFLMRSMTILISGLLAIRFSRRAFMPRLVEEGPLGTGVREVPAKEEASLSD
jgi:hypothetical protein